MAGGIQGKVGQIQTMLARDYDTLRLYNEKESPMSFPELQQLARTKVIDFRGKKFGIMRNKLSDRIPMTVVDLQGNRRPGVFTKASYVDFKSKFNNMLQDAASYYDSPEFLNTVGPYRRFLFEHDRPAGCQTKDDITDEQVVEKMKSRITGLLPKYRDYLIQNNMRVYGKRPEEMSEELLAYSLAEKVVDERNASIGFRQARCSASGGRRY